MNYPPVENSINLTGISAFMDDLESTNITDLEKRIVYYEQSQDDEIDEEDNPANVEIEIKNKWESMRRKLGMTSENFSEDDSDNSDDSGDDDDNDSISDHKVNIDHRENFARSDMISQPRIENQYVDEHLTSISEEQKRQKILQNAINSRSTIPLRQGGMINMEFEKSEDKKNILLEEINMIKTSLIDEGASVDDVTTVTTHSSFAEIDSVYKQLRYRNDHRRYCMFANEMAQMGAAGLEWIFDGKKKYIGGLRPDLTDWGATLNIKMRRLNYEMSSVVSTGMRNYNIGEVGRIILELVPSMFLHSKMRNSRYGGNKPSGKTKNVDYTNALNICRDMEDGL